MKYILTCCLLFILSSCNPVEEKTVTGSIRTPDEFRWKNSPGKLYLTDSDIDADVDAMADEWNRHFFDPLIRTDLAPNGVTQFKKSFTTIEEAHDGYNAIYLVPETYWPSNSTGALGVTILLGRTNNYGQYIIEEADIIVRKARLTNYDAQTIILHELGHFMGLQHQTSYSSIMYESIYPGQVKNRPLNSDLNLLARLYNLPYGSIPQSPRLPVQDGTGELKRMVLELGADQTCRHLIDGKVVKSHSVKLKHFD